MLVSKLARRQYFANYENNVRKPQRQLRYVEGMCFVLSCPFPRGKGIYCDKHHQRERARHQAAPFKQKKLEKARARRRHRLGAGLCLDCGGPPLADGKYCARCLDRKRLSRVRNGRTPRNTENRQSRRSIVTKKVATLAERYPSRFNRHACAICGSAPKGKKVLALDHCHDSGELRGLLCFACNVGLGFFRDNIKNLASAIKYLKTAPPSVLPFENGGGQNQPNK